MSRKAQRRKKYTIQIIGLIVAVCVVIGISFVFQTWWNGRPGTAPQEVAVSVSIGGGESTKVLPYLVCESGTECPQGELTPLPITDADSVDISVPKDIYDHDWAVLAIYDDPAANSETYHGAYEAETASIPATVELEGVTARLLVVEINSILIGTGSDGEETPFPTTWSIAVNNPAAELAASS